MKTITVLTEKGVTTTTEVIGWFEYTKDLIIPSLSVIATVVIGIFITIALKKREEKSKIKQLLIDNYMDYLTARTKDVVYETEATCYEVLNDILINFNEYINNNANLNITFGVIKKRVEEIKIKVQELENHENNWSYFTYRFTFLLGEKKYFSEALPLEKIIEQNMLARDSRKKFKAKMINIIKQNDEIISNINTADIFKIELGIHSIIETIVYEYNDYQFKNFNPYNVKIAKLISDM
jgi:hypothetical protein